MFGLHKFPVRINRDGLSITLEKLDQHCLYRRESSDGVVEKILLEAPKEIVLQPVEPLNQPSRITPYLLIEFATTVIVPPRGEQFVFLRFPVEIGVFLPRKEQFDLLETISLSRKKFSLYGTPREGHVTRYWNTPVATAAPKTDPLYEGVLKLEIHNDAGEWLPVKRAVFDANGMRIFYKKNLVAAQARMTIVSDRKAETEFINAPLEKGMESSIELFKPGKLVVTTARYYMGEGI